MLTGMRESSTTAAGPRQTVGCSESPQMLPGEHCRSQPVLAFLRFVINIRSLDATGDALQWNQEMNGVGFLCCADSIQHTPHGRRQYNARSICRLSIFESPEAGRDSNKKKNFKKPEKPGKLLKESKIGSAKTREKPDKNGEA